MRPRWYILEGREVRPAKDMLEAGMQFAPDNKSRIIGSDTISGFSISTVFLVFDHRHFGDGPPILFETMIFGPRGRVIDFYQTRCSTYDQAEKMHQNAIIHIKARYIIPNSEGQAFSTVSVGPAGKFIQDKNISLIKRLKKNKKGKWK